MGRYIAALDAPARDRLIRAQQWISHCANDLQGGGCLRGHAEGIVSGSRINAATCRALASAVPAFGVRTNEKGELYRLDEGHTWDRSHPAYVFNNAFDRWPDRTIRAIKLRAAKLNGCSPEAIAHLLEQRQEIPA